MPGVLDIKIDFNPKQRIAYAILDEGIVSVLGYGGARGGGKSYFGRTRIIIDLLNNADTTGLIVRKTFPELERNHIKSIKKEWPNLLYDYKETKHYFIFGNGSQLDLTYCDTIKDLEKLQGGEYDYILIDEAEQYPEIFFQDIRACNRTTHGVKPYVVLGFNPGGVGHHWLKRLFIDRRFTDNENPTDYDFVKATMVDNGKLDQMSYRANLMALPEAKRRAWLYGDFDSFEGQYFNNFGGHLIEEPTMLSPAITSGRLYGSMDYGYGLSGFSSFGMWYVDPQRVPHRLYTWYRRGLTASEQADDLFDYVTSFHYTHGALPTQVFCDNNMWTSSRLNERTRAPIDYFKEKFSSKVIWTQANKARINGWQVVLDYFSLDILSKQPKMRYWSKYNKTFAENFPQMMSDPNRPEDVHKCDNDHVCDETRYGLVGIRASQGEIVTDQERQFGAINFNNSVMNALSGHNVSVTGF